MSKITWEGATLLAPVPAVLVSLGSMENSNVITVAWTGIINSDPPMTYISVRPERFSHHILRETGEFVINMASENLVRRLDYCGVKSGKNVDKFAECHFTKEKCSKVSAPAISESPLNLECKVKEVLSFPTHDMFIAEILAVNVDDSLINKNGKLDLTKANLTVYSHGEYFALGKTLGKFGFSVKKKK